MPHIYKITNQVNGKAYVGYTKYTPEQRFHEHADSDRGYDICKAFREFGKDAFIIETLYTSEDAEYTLRVMEPHFITLHDTFNNGYNMNLGGSGLLEHSDASKKKMSENNYWRGKDRSGANNPMHGRKHSEASIKKMRDRRKGKTAGENHHMHGKHHSESTREKIRQKAIGRAPSNKGVPMSEETKRKLSEAMKGRVGFTKRYIVTTPEGEELMVENMSAFCRCQGLSAGNMSSCAKGTMKHTKGYTARYA